MGVSEVVVNGRIGNTRIWIMMTYDRMISFKYTYIVSFVRRNLIGMSLFSL